MKSVEDFNFHGRKALVRVDFNVPLNDQFKVTDDTRILAAMPTIRKILNDGGSVVLTSHLGRPKNGGEEKFSLRHIIPKLSEYLGLGIIFGGDCVSENAAAISGSLQAGQVMLLDNLRFHQQEIKGDKSFAKKLAQHGDIYVNDAFGTAHRVHASTVTIAQFFKEKCCGYVMKAELENVHKILENPEKPFTAIMGGAKISDKIIVVERMLDKVDNLIIGGGMSYTFTKALGGQIGNSLLEESKLTLATSLLEQAKQKQVNLLLPVDALCTEAFSNEAKTKICPNNAIPAGWMGLDIGTKTRQLFHETIINSKTLLWNGPMGVFEMSNFAQGTKHISHSVVKATQKGGFSLIGGGDSAAAVNMLGFGKQVSYISTGGGALLEYIEGKILPAVAAL